MAISWDYMAGVKGTQMGMKQSADANLATQRAADARNKQAYLKNKALKDKEEEAKAQEQVIRQSEALQTQTFFTAAGGEDELTYAGLNSVYEKGTQDLISTYTDIKNNKDMDSTERARLMRTLTSQVPLIKSSKAAIDEQMKAYAAAAQTGDVSGAMDPQFQQVYADLIKGEFDGGIAFEGDSMVFAGTTSTGESIRLPLSEFGLKLPSVVTKGGTLMDSADGYLDDLKIEIDAYNKTGFNGKGLRKPPEFDPESKADAIRTLIEKNSGDDAMYVYGMDTLNLTREEIDDRVNALEGKEMTSNVLEESVRANLPTTYADGRPLPEGYYDNLASTQEVYTTADAREQVMEDMIAQEVNVLQGIYNSKVGRAQAPVSELSLVDKTYASILQEGQDSLSTGTLGLTAQDFNVGKSAGFDNIASNIQEGFNDDGQYVVSYEQANTGPYTENVDGTPIEPRRISYNLSTTGGAKDFLLARFENEQGGRGSNAKDTKESKEDALKLAPGLAKSFRDVIKAQKDAEAAAAAAAAAAEAARLKQQEIMQNRNLDPFSTTDFNKFKRPN